MKVFFFLLLFITLITYIKSEKPIRTYVVLRDKPAKSTEVPGLTIFDSTEKTQLYRLKPVRSDIDTMVLVDYPAKNIVANLEGEWIDDKVNVTFSTYDYTFNKWIDGTISRKLHFFHEKYPIEWNSNRLFMKCGHFSRRVKVYDEKDNKFLAQFRRRTRWSLWSRFKYDLKIYSDKIPDMIYFLGLAIVDFRERVYPEQS